MNYEKHYRLLCQSRQQLNRQKLKCNELGYIYYEWHHIVPRHEAGSDEASNLVLLTAREHFIAHWLFAKWKQTRKAWAAVSAMAFTSNKAERKLTSRQFELCRIANSKANSGKNSYLYGRTGSAHPVFGTKHSEARALKHRANNSGSANPSYGRANSDETKLMKRHSALKRWQMLKPTNARAEIMLIIEQILQ